LTIFWRKSKQSVEKILFRIYHKSKQDIPAMKIADVLVTLIVFLLASAASWIIGNTLAAIIGPDGLFAGAVIFLVCLRQILLWHKRKQLLTIPDLILSALFGWFIYSHTIPYIGNWGIFAGVVVFLTGLAIVAHMQAWEIKI
jgi:hypothetical protein